MSGPFERPWLPLSGARRDRPKAVLAAIAAWLGAAALLLGAVFVGTLIARLALALTGVP